MHRHPRVSAAVVVALASLTDEARSQQVAPNVGSPGSAPTAAAPSPAAPAAASPSLAAPPSVPAMTPPVAPEGPLAATPWAPPSAAAPLARGPYDCAPLAPPGYGYFLVPAESPFAPAVGAGSRGVPGVTGASMLEYTEGQPVPLGYHLERRARRGLVLAGSLTAGVPFLVSFLTGLSIGLSGSRRDGEATVALMAPVVGPFITIHTAEAEGAGVLWLMLDGAAQLAGIGMLIGGLVAQQDKLIRDYQDASLVPDVRVGPGSATATWTF
ncbi:MAG: hypothetical protein FJ095_20415 [Deltaproteobacteria bacterium]|nr:hypothetical protein [Deltaproteobacteria bacterium]